MFHVATHGIIKETDLQPSVAHGYKICFRLPAMKPWQERLKYATENQPKTDTDLALDVTQLSGITVKRGAINHWINGRNEPKVSQFLALCAAMGCDPGAILFQVPVLKTDTKIVTDALASEPKKNPNYKMQEKRLTKRKHAKESA